MSDEDTFEYKDYGLTNLLKAIKASDLPSLKVGVLGGSDVRDGGMSNATIGAKHEFGIDGMPQRSFLRVPINEHLADYLDETEAFDEESTKNVMREASVVPWLQKVGIVALTVIQDAFASGGFGKWKAWRAGYQSNTGDILVDTRQLRDSITSEVTE